MEKINFENYPSTNSPINGTNLNLLQDNVENDIGLLNNLNTTDKSNSVNAINEVNNKLLKEISFSQSLWFYGMKVGGDTFQVMVPIYTGMKNPTVNLTASVYSTSSGWNDLNYSSCRVFDTFIILCFASNGIALENGNVYLVRMNGTINFN